VSDELAGNTYLLKLTSLDNREGFAPANVRFGMLLGIVYDRIGRKAASGDPACERVAPDHPGISPQQPRRLAGKEGPWAV